MFRDACTELTSCMHWNGIFSVLQYVIYGHTSRQTANPLTGIAELVHALCQKSSHPRMTLRIHLLLVSTIEIAYTEHVWHGKIKSGSWGRGQIHERALQCLLNMKSVTILVFLSALLLSTTYQGNNALCSICPFVYVFWAKNDHYRTGFYEATRFIRRIYSPRPHFAGFYNPA